MLPHFLLAAAVHEVRTRFSSFGCPAARCTPAMPDRLRRCPAVQPAAITVFARRHLPRRTGGQLCAHRTGEPLGAYRLAGAVPYSGCSTCCPCPRSTAAWRSGTSRTGGLPPAERDCGRPFSSSLAGGVLPSGSRDLAGGCFSGLMVAACTRMHTRNRRDEHCSPTNRSILRCSGAHCAPLRDNVLNR